MKKESFEERHGDKISILKLVLIVVCLIAIPVTFLWNHRDVGSVNSRVTKVESPCLRYGPKSEACKRAFEQAVLTITHAEACSILRKAGLEIVNCKGARLKQERGRDKKRSDHAASKGVTPQTPSTAHQQPPPSHAGGGHSGGTKGTHHASPKPPPSEPAPAAPAPAPTPPAPGNSSSTPGADNGLKACVESVVSACVKAETPELPLHP